MFKQNNRRSRRVDWRVIWMARFNLSSLPNHGRLLNAIEDSDLLLHFRIGIQLTINENVSQDDVGCLEGHSNSWPATDNATAE